MSEGEGQVRRRVVVAGRVQGVFFRATCRDEAAGRGVAGNARNLPDGTVEVVLEGPEPAVGQMIEWCRRGPAGAQVSSVQVREEEPEGLSGFAID